MSDERTEAVRSALQMVKRRLEGNGVAAGQVLGLLKEVWDARNDAVSAYSIGKAEGRNEVAGECGVTLNVCDE